MKLLITLALASLLLLKVAEGAIKGYDETCSSGDTCSTTGATCTDGTKCACPDIGVVSDDKTTCLLKDGQTCTDDDQCSSKKCEGTETKKCGSGAAAITSSLILMAVTLVTSRFL